MVGLRYMFRCVNLCFDVSIFDFPCQFSILLHASISMCALDVIHQFLCGPFLFAITSVTIFSKSYKTYDLR